MKKVSAGLLMFRIRANALQVLLVHPGGPLWRSKDAGIWSIPKGEVQEGEDLLVTAKREFEEETGIKPSGPFHPLGSVVLKSGKVTHGWAFQGDCDPAGVHSNTCEIEWPPNSGEKMTIPEIDRADFFTIGEATEKLSPAQVSFLHRLRAHVNSGKIDEANA